MGRGFDSPSGSNKKGETLPPILKQLKTKKMKVYKFTTPNDDFKYCVVGDDAVKTTFLKDTYDAYGQKFGVCMEYSPDNPDGEFWDETIQKIKENVGFAWLTGEPSDIALDIEPEFFDNYLKVLLDEGIKLPAKVAEIVKTAFDNVEYIEVKAFTYWDGRNYRSLIVQGDLDGDIEEVEEEEARQILEAVKVVQKKAPYFDGVSDSKKVNGYDVFRTRWTSDPFIARVI